jgi:transcriptional regulator with GAF, ATPase, and Fis domain
MAQGNDIAYLKETEARLEESQALLSEAQREVYMGKIKSRRHTRKTTSALRAANVALTETLDLPTVLETLLDYLEELAPCDSGDILLRQNSGSLVLYAQRGYGRRPSWRRIVVDEFDHLAAVIRNKESLRIHNIQNYPNWRPHFPKAGETRSWLGIPLSVGGQIIGLCSLNHSEPNHFNDECRRWPKHWWPRRPSPFKTPAGSPNCGPAAKSCGN